MKCCECGKSNAQYQCIDCGSYFCIGCADANTMKCECINYENIVHIGKREKKE